MPVLRFGLETLPTSIPALIRKCVCTAPFHEEKTCLLPQQVQRSPGTNGEMQRAPWAQV